MSRDLRAQKCSIRLDAVLNTGSLTSFSYYATWHTRCLLIMMLSYGLGKKKDYRYLWTEIVHVAALLRELQFIIYYRKWSFSVDCQEHLVAGAKALVRRSLDNSPLRLHSRWSYQAVTDRDVNSSIASGLWRNSADALRNSADALNNG